MQHDTVTVHTFLRVLLSHLKQLQPDLRKVLYFSDGAASQYKNYKNFCNLLHHNDDFQAEAECHFFATSHGKSACDGIGGTVKRLVARASLQRETTGQILTSQQLFDWAVDHITGIKFFFAATDAVEENRSLQQKRFSTAQTVAGSHSHHCFIPNSDGTLRMSRISADIATVQVSLSNTELNVGHFAPGMYVAAVYDSDYYFGTVTSVSDEHQDVTISFMTPKAPSKSFTWPRRADESPARRGHILKVLAPPSTATGWAYHFDQSAVLDVANSFLEFSKKHF